MSFAAVLTTDLPPVTSEDTKALPIVSAPLLRSITIPLFGPQSATLPNSKQISISFANSTDGPHTASTTASNTSEATFMTTQSDLEEIKAQNGPRRRFYSMGHRSSGDIARDLSKLPQLLTGQGLKTALQGIFRTSRESSSSGSNITLPVPRTGTVRNSKDVQPVGEFDMGALRRVRRQRERNQIRTGTYVGGFEDVDTQTVADRDLRTCGSSVRTVSSCYSCASESSASDIENRRSAMRTGAVRGIPAASVLAVAMSEKQGTVVQTREVESDSDDGPERGVDLQSIMAQV
jgi:hypothetical protein